MWHICFSVRIILATFGIFCLYSESHHWNGCYSLLFLFLAGPKISNKENTSLFLFRLWISCAFQILISVYFTSGSSLFFHILSSTVFILNNETWLMLFVFPCWDIFNTRIFLLYSALSILAEYESYFSGLSESLIHAQNTLWSKRDLPSSMVFLIQDAKNE